MFTNVNLAAPFGALAIVGAGFVFMILAIALVYGLTSHKFRFSRGVLAVAVVLVGSRTSENGSMAVMLPSSSHAHVEAGLGAYRASRMGCGRRFRGLVRAVRVGGQLFARVFGTPAPGAQREPVNHEFAQLLAELCSAIDDYGSTASFLVPPAGKLRSGLARAVQRLRGNGRAKPAVSA